MPTMSRCFSNPWLTPPTAFATMLRAKPCRADCSGFSRRATSRPSCRSSRIPAGSGTRNVPFGPFTTTADGWTSTVTPEGRSIGLLPIRDIEPVPSEAKDLNSGNAAEYLAPDASLAGALSAHHTARRGQDIDSEVSQDLGDFAGSDVNAPAGPRDPLQGRNHTLTVRGVTQDDPQGFLLPFLG